MENKLNWFGKVLEWVDKYGLLKIFKAGIGLIFISYVMVITLNPSIVYNKVVTYIEQTHNSKTIARNEATLKIKYKLKELLQSTNADRAWVIEYHNGTTGLGGLPFTYGVMNAEEVKPGIRPVSSHYKDFLLSDYTSIIEFSKNDGWFGNIDSLEADDPRLYYAFKSNRVNEIAVFYLKTEDKDIGILGLSFCDTPMPYDTWVHLRRTGIQISIILNKI